MRVSSVRTPAVRARLGLFAVLGAALLFPACGRPGHQPVYPVQGQVLLEGTPLPGAQVFLHPIGQEEGGQPVRPVGRAGPDGSFRLTTYDADDGAPAGTYAVTVELRRRPPGQPEGDFSRNVLPARYANPQTSPLRVEVAAGANDLGPLRLARR